MKKTEAKVLLRKRFHYCKVLLREDWGYLSYFVIYRQIIKPVLHCSKKLGLKKLGQEKTGMYIRDKQSILIFTKTLFRKMNKRFPKLKYIWILIFLILINSCTSITAYFGGKKETLNQKRTDFYIPTGTNIEELKELLVLNKIIDDSEAFQAVLDYKEFTDVNIGPGKFI